MTISAERIIQIEKCTTFLDFFLIPSKSKPTGLLSSWKGMKHIIVEKFFYKTLSE